MLRSWRPDAQVLTDEDALAAVSKAKNGAAAGPSGWRNEHIRAACDEGVGLTAVTLIMQRVAVGEFGGASALRATQPRCCMFCRTATALFLSETCTPPAHSALSPAMCFRQRSIHR
eukprot:SAG25_NODE_1144_length_3810_cov_1.881164_4_plen_116_part_00